MKLSIHASPSAPQGWDAYVGGHPSHTTYHTAGGVEIGRRAFGLTTTFLTCRDEQGHVRGVLPLVEQSSLWFGRYLSSIPFFNYGGILSDGDAATKALARAAAELRQARRARHVELRHEAESASLTLPVRLDKVSMHLALPDSQEVLAKQLGAKLRSQIRRADREQPQVEWGGAHLLPEFYAVFAATMHRLGTPVYPQRFFDVVLDALGELSSVLVVRVAHRPVAAAITVRHGRRVEVPWAAATEHAKRTSVNMRLYWEMLVRAIDEEMTVFDFGRSTKDGGTFKFKAQWGAQPRPLYWYYCLPADGELPRLNHSNRKYAAAAAVWRTIPLWCANLLGPRIARHLP